MTDDQSLGDDSQHDNPFEHAPDAHEPIQLLTVEDVLASARLVERTASICLRSDLVADHDMVLDELSTLVTPDGELLGGDDEHSMDEQSAAARARELAERLAALKAEMRGSMWHVRFRAMPSDEWSTFKKLWWPKAKGADMTEFRTKLIAECAINPTITEAQARELRKKFSVAQFNELSDTAFSACTAGGMDVPKSPSSWANLAQQ